MAKHLTPRELRAIVELIRSWPGGKLTWTALCTEASEVLGRRPARQTLYSYDDIVSAYRAKRGVLRTQVFRTPLPNSLALAAQRLARQQSVIDELVMKNNALLERFVRWQYNAYKHGISEAQLNAELPRINRGRTVG